MIWPKKPDSLLNLADIRTERNHSKDKHHEKLLSHKSQPVKATHQYLCLGWMHTSSRGPGISPRSQILCFAKSARVHSASLL